MDERLSQIKEGEGLSESRVNQDLIDFLQKWSTPALVLLLVIVAGYVGWQQLEKRRIARVNQAFSELEAAGPAASASPDALLGLASQYDDVRSVGVLARLRAADAYMVAVRRGIKPGSPLNPDGTLQNEDDALDEQSRTLFLDRAENQYDEVRQRCTGKPNLAIHEINALYGLAAVAESRGDLDGARALYERVADLAASASLEPHPEIARERIASLDTLDDVPTLYAAANLPELPWEATPEIPEQPEGGDAGAGDDQGAGDQAGDANDAGAGDAGGDQGAGNDAGDDAGGGGDAGDQGTPPGGG